MSRGSDLFMPHAYTAPTGGHRGSVSIEAHKIPMADKSRQYSSVNPFKDHLDKEIKSSSKKYSSNEPKQNLHALSRQDNDPVKEARRKNTPLKSDDRTEAVRPDQNPRSSQAQEAKSVSYDDTNNDAITEKTPTSEKPQESEDMTASQDRATVPHEENPQSTGSEQSISGSPLLGQNLAQGDDPDSGIKSIANSEAKTGPNSGARSGNAPSTAPEKVPMQDPSGGRLAQATGLNAPTQLPLTSELPAAQITGETAPIYTNGADAKAPLIDGTLKSGDIASSDPASKEASATSTPSAHTAAVITHEAEDLPTTSRVGPDVNANLDSESLNQEQGPTLSKSDGALTMAATQRQTAIDGPQQMASPVAQPELLKDSPDGVRNKDTVVTQGDQVASNSASRGDSKAQSENSDTSGGSTNNKAATQNASPENKAAGVAQDKSSAFHIPSTVSAAPSAQGTMPPEISQGMMTRGDANNLPQQTSLLSLQEIGQPHTLGATNLMSSSGASSNMATSNMPHINPQMVIKQINIAIAKQAGVEGMDSFKISLKPADLGQVDIKMHFLADGRMTATVTVENERTLHLLQKDQGSLEKALENAGFNTGGNDLNFSLKKHQQNQENTDFSSRNKQDEDEDGQGFLPQNNMISQQQMKMTYSNNALDINI